MQNDNNQFRIKKGRTFLGLSTKGKLFFIFEILGITFAVIIVLFFFGLLPGLGDYSQVIEDPYNIESQFVGYKFQEVTTRTSPDQIIIDKIGVNSIIEQPVSRNVTALDEALKKGAVYYPGSGTIEEGNVFIFGHSTNWPVVRNQAYKIFNDLDKLTSGDTVKLVADGKTYSYRVTSVKLALEDDVLVDFSQSDRKITLSTCNTFGAKQERFVVEAVFVSSS